MIKLKIVTIFCLGIILFLFVGIINKNHEFYEPEICLKYPTYKIFFTSPDLPDEYKIDELPTGLRKKILEYDKNCELNKNLGVFSKIIVYFLIQLFLTFLCVKLIRRYKKEYFLVDIFFFIISISILYILISLGLYYNKKVLFLIIIIVLNYLFNFKLRNVILRKLDRHKE